MSMKKVFPYYHQLDSVDCGPTCLRMIAKYFWIGRVCFFSKEIFERSRVYMMIKSQ